MTEQSIRGPECHVSVTVEKNTKGYNATTHVSLRWENRFAVVDDDLDSDNDIEPFVVVSPGIDGVDEMPSTPAAMLTTLVQMAEKVAAEEIVRRKALDAAEGGQP